MTAQVPGSARPMSRTWAFDVDGTLVGSIRSDVLRPGTAGLLSRLADRGIGVVAWSAGGAEYARRLLAEHGVADSFVAFYDKGQRDIDGHYSIDHLDPVHRPSVFVDDSPVDLDPAALVVGVAQFMGNNPSDTALIQLTADIDRIDVMTRLRALFTVWGSEQAVQHEDGWLAWESIGRLARELEMLIGDATSVHLVMRQRPEILAVELGLLSRGCSVTLVSPLQSDADLVRDLGGELDGVAPAVVVAHIDDIGRPGVLETLHAIDATLVSVDRDGRLELLHRGATRPSGATVVPVAVTVQTSGTTGPAKRLSVPWSTFLELGDGLDGGRPAVSGRGAVILSLPLITLGGLLSVARLVFGGRPLSMMERFDVHRWAALVKEHRPKVIGAPPPVVRMILDADIDPACFDGVTAYVTSSGPVAPDVAREFEKRYGFPVLLGYGATEFLNAVTGWSSDLWERFGSTKLGSVGRAVRGAALRVLDLETGLEVGVDEPGVLEVDPPQRAAGLPAGWLRTSDRARIDHDGFVWILGRTDDVIIRGGFKVDLTSVEAALLAHPDVDAVCAVGLADARSGSVPAAVVVVRDPAAFDESEMMSWVRSRVAAYATPVAIMAVGAIPLTSTLKPHRAGVVALLENRSPAG